MKISKCRAHANGKTCTQVIAEGNCLKTECKLFPRVLKMIPKFKNLYEMEVRGVIPTTVWDFSEKGMKAIERRKKKAKQWLRELYPKVKKNLPSFLCAVK